MLEVVRKIRRVAVLVVVAALSVVGLKLIAPMAVVTVSAVAGLLFSGLVLRRQSQFHQTVHDSMRGSPWQASLVAALVITIVTGAVWLLFGNRVDDGLSLLAYAFASSCVFFCAATGAAFMLPRPS